MLIGNMRIELSFFASCLTLARRFWNQFYRVGSAFALIDGHISTYIDLIERDTESIGKALLD